MALIKCPECGKEISDKAPGCPNCGCPASEFHAEVVPEDARTELEKMADEIFWETPADINRNGKILSKRGGINIIEAKRIMTYKYDLWRKEQKQGKYPDTEYCPFCGSQEIERYNPGVTATGKANVLGGVYISSSASSSRRMECLRCGRNWKPKR